MSDKHTHCWHKGSRFVKTSHGKFLPESVESQKDGFMLVIEVFKQCCYCGEQKQYPQENIVLGDRRKGGVLSQIVGGVEGVSSDTIKDAPIMGKGC